MTHLEAHNYSGPGNLPVELRRAVVAGDCSIITPRNPILLPLLTGIASPSSRRWIAMRNRRAHILAMTRRLIAEESYDHVVMRRLADRSDVTIPTIYNLIGGRDEVLRLAISEALRAKIIFARAKAELKQINPILAFVDTIWTCLANDPDYSRQLVRAIVHQDMDGRLRKIIVTEIRSAVETWLNMLEAAGNFRRTGIPTRTMAEFILQQIAAAVASWAENRTETNDLRRNLAQGTGLLLLGTLGDEEAAKVTNWLKLLEELIAKEASMPDTSQGGAACESVFERITPFERRDSRYCSRLRP